jgi:hypothetical protein
MTPEQIQRHGRALLESVEQGLAAPPQRAPEPAREPEEVQDRYDRLHTWRKNKARARGVESDVILPRTALWDLARRPPRTPEQLTGIADFGPWRRQTYGPEILALLRVLIVGIALMGSQLFAQEPKKVPKDSVRVSIPGCVKGYVFTAGRRTTDEPGSVNVPEGTHFRMNGPKKLINEIKAQEGSMIMLTGVTLRGQYLPGGVPIGGGVRVGPSSGTYSSAVAGQLSIDVEGWRPTEGHCPSSSK